MIEDMKPELELKHIAPYLPYKLRVVEWYRGKQIHDEFVVDCVNWDGENIESSDATLDSFELERMFHLRDIKPILRPLSSMTEKESDEIEDIIGCNFFIYISNNGIEIEDIIIDPWGGQSVLRIETLNRIYEWLFAHHFDMFNLIENDLAIEKK